jgi:drug/metabolite transporter (DMT)-like permease
MALASSALLIGEPISSAQIVGGTLAITGLVLLRRTRHQG